MKITYGQAKADVYTLLAGRNYAVHTRSEKGYEWLEDEEYVSVSVENDAGDTLYIDITDEITFAFDDYHAHFCLSDDEFEEFTVYLSGLLSGEMYTMCCYCGDEWLCSDFREGIPDKDDILKDDISIRKLLKDHGKIRIVCRYWNIGKNITFELPGL